MRLGLQLRLAAGAAVCLSLMGQGAASVAQDADIAPLVEAGKPVYETYCASCHAGNGRGDIGPSLIDNGKLKDAAFVVRQIAQGGDEMPPFSGSVSDEEILAVATYVMNSWGNAFGPVP